MTAGQAACGRALCSASAQRGCVPTITGPLRIGTVTYPSAKAAARALGVSERTIHRITKLSDQIDTYMPHPPKPHPVVINGVAYPSIHAAARATGWSRTTVRRHMDTNNQPITHTPRHPQSVTINDETYPSIAAAARALGMPPANLRYRLKKAPARRTSSSSY
ncbi:MAG: hypothetical protein HC828_03995 [Blastochloris sp.]|nr:hypothetical protein [Blastochloris sp.]